MSDHDRLTGDQNAALDERLRDAFGEEDRNRYVCAHWLTNEVTVDCTMTFEELYALASNALQLREEARRMVAAWEAAPSPVVPVPNTVAPDVRNPYHFSDSRFEAWSKGFNGRVVSGATNVEAALKGGAAAQAVREWHEAMATAGCPYRIETDPGAFESWGLGFAHEVHRFVSNGAAYTQGNAARTKWADEHTPVKAAPSKPVERFPTVESILRTPEPVTVIVEVKTSPTGRHLSKMFAFPDRYGRGAAFLGTMAHWQAMSQRPALDGDFSKLEERVIGQELGKGPLTLDELRAFNCRIHGEDILSKEYIDALKEADPKNFEQDFDNFKPCRDV